MGRVSTCKKIGKTIDLRGAQVNYGSMIFNGTTEKKKLSMRKRKVYVFTMFQSNNFSA